MHKTGPIYYIDGLVQENVHSHWVFMSGLYGNQAISLNKLCVCVSGGEGGSSAAGYWELFNFNNFFYLKWSQNCHYSAVQNFM